jgi:putative Mn2+ efflux pump MntP
VLRTGLIFGAIETLTPLVGWGLGMLASQFVLEWNLLLRIWVCAGWRLCQ